MGTVYRQDGRRNWMDQGTTRKARVVTLPDGRRLFPRRSGASGAIGS